MDNFITDNFIFDMQNHDKHTLMKFWLTTGLKELPERKKLYYFI